MITSKKTEWDIFSPAISLVDERTGYRAMLYASSVEAPFGTKARDTDGTWWSLEDLDGKLSWKRLGTSGDPFDFCLLSYENSEGFVLTSVSVLKLQAEMQSLKRIIGEFAMILGGTEDKADRMASLLDLAARLGANDMQNESG